MPATKAARLSRTWRAANWAARPFRSVPAEAAVALGMRRAASLPELSREIGPGAICINLTMTDVVENVVFGPGGLIEGLHKDALIIDFGAPLVAGTSGWKVDAGHFAERHGLIIIIALGESVVALGVSAAGEQLSPR